MEKYYVEIPPNASSVFYDTLQSALLNGSDSASVVLSTTLYGRDGLLSQNNLYFASPKYLKLKKPAIVMRAIDTPFGYRVLLVADQLVKSARVSTLVPGEFSENYFDLIPGEIYEVFFKTKVRDNKLTDKIEVKSLFDSYE